MDEVRLDMLSKHINEMESGLVDMIKRFTDFTKSEKPRIGVVCSDNQLRMEMEQIFTVRTDIDAVVYVSNSEEDNLYDLMLTDAVVAVTNALQLAPVGLFDTLKKLSEVSKEIYFLLGGWGALPKTPEMLKAKTGKVPEEFPTAKIISVDSFYSEKLDGFLLVQEAADKCAAHILASFERQHSAQSEALYSWLKKSIADFYTACNQQIDSEVSMTLNISQIVAAKQGLYELKFTHSAVSMQNFAELVSARIGEITLGDLERACGDLDSMARGNIQAARRSAKRALGALLTEALDSCLGDADNPVRIKSQATADECLNEMAQINARIQNSTYITAKLKESFAKETGDTSDLDKIVNKYDEIAVMTLERARKRIPAVAEDYQYTLTPGFMEKARVVGGEIIKVLKEIDLDDENDQKPIDDENADKKPDLSKPKDVDIDDMDRRNIADVIEDKKPDLAQLEAECFFADTKKMISESLAAASDIIYKCGDEVTAEINAYSSQMLKGYFGRIIALLEHIEKYLEALHDDYALNREEK